MFDEHRDRLRNQISGFPGNKLALAIIQTEVWDPSISIAWIPLFESLCWEQENLNEVK